MSSNAISRDTVLDVIKDIAARDWGLSTSGFTESTLIADLPGVDSVKRLRATARVEDMYDIDILSENVQPASTVGEFADQVMAGLAARSD